MNNVTPTGKSTISNAKKPNRKWIWIFIATIMVATGYAYYSKSIKQNQGNSTTSTNTKAEGKRGVGTNPIPVISAIAKTGDINVYLSGLGTVTPLATVTVKPRVDGEIIKINFKEGQMVQKGEILGFIDPRPFEAALTQARGQLMRDQALLTDAKLNLIRYQTLLKEDAIAAQQVDTQQALVKQYEGTIKVDEGLFTTATLNLAYTKVVAPVTGRVGLRQIDMGNVIHASDATGLVVITQLQPMSVLFSLAEDSIPDLMKKMKTDSKLVVNAFDRAFKEKIAIGILRTIDNQIDPTTGMVKLRGEFANTDLTLFPNQFVNAQVLLETKRQVVVAPSAAVQRGRNGSFAFVVADDSTVKQRPVVVGVVEGNRSEIIRGLANGEMVVIDGTDKLRDGDKVVVSSMTVEAN